MTTRSAAAPGPGQHEIEALVALFGQRRYAEAEQQARALTARFPHDGFGWKALGAVLKQLRRLDDAIVPLRRAAELMAGDAEAHYNLGTALLEQGQLSAAEASYRRTIALNEHYLPAYYNLGNLLQTESRFAEAEHCYRAVLRMQSDFAEGLSNLGVVIKAQGRADEAEACFRRALAIDPRNAQSLVNLAYIVHAAGQGGEAEQYLRQALAVDASVAEAHNMLGVVLREQSRLEEALACYLQALAVRPEYAEAHNNIGNVLRQLARYAEAEAAYRNALTLQPDYAEAHYNLGNVYKDQSLFSEAEASYRQALAIKSDYAEAQNNLGNALKGQSRLELAAAAYDAAIALRPDFIEPHYALSLLKTYRIEDPHRRMLDELEPTLATLSVEAQVRYWFTVGKVCEDVGDYDASFSAYRQGNALQRALLHWDDAAQDALFERMTGFFTPAFFATRPKPRHEGKAPIFIVGMPRSGTSLLEQILASYPGVYGAGEMPDLSEVIVAAMPDADYAKFPEALAGFDAADFRRMGEQYTERLWRHAPDAGRITDKMPANFFYIGLIHLMLPQAKIIHAMRDPMDSCFSCYSRLFNESNLSFAYDLGTLGRYYARYIRLMRHWHAVLPPGTILDMPYESMVGDTETQARRLLSYLDLPWDERCLAFHENQRRVKTASVAQVRKPIYRTSLARWQRFASHLEPLQNLVQEFRDS
jgi:tetratricopeptide (TPR) repeat protein